MGFLCSSAETAVLPKTKIWGAVPYPGSYRSASATTHNRVALCSRVSWQQRQQQLGNWPVCIETWNGTFFLFLELSGLMFNAATSSLHGCTPKFSQASRYATRSLLFRSLMCPKSGCWLLELGGAFFCILHL